VTLRFETTPNPNALKCVLDTPRAGPIVSAGKSEETGGDALAVALLGIPGVMRVLLHTTFVTICKEPGSDWEAIKREVQRYITREPS
jgi:hypothetical protein